MPICDGVEATKKLRQLEATMRTPTKIPSKQSCTSTQGYHLIPLVVALSADAQESTKQLCLSAGMNAFFTKPLKKDDLQQV